MRISQFTSQTGVASYLVPAFRSKLLACLVAIFLTIDLAAQLPEYYVDLIKGEVMVQRKKKITPIKPRNFIYKDDIIVIRKSNSELTLVNKDAKYVVLNKKGSYKVPDLIKADHKTPHGITGKYFHLVWEELFHPMKDYSKFKMENLASAWGGVSRGSCDLNLFPIDAWISAADTIRFSWMHDDPVLNYTFTLKDRYSKIIFQLAVRDTQLVLNKSGLAQGTEAIFYWSVNSASEPCSAVPENKLLWLSRTEYQRRTDEIVASVNNTNLPHFNLAVAQKLKNEGFFELAAEYFRKAVLGN